MNPGLSFVCVWVLILITPKTKMNSQIEEEQVMPKRGLTVLEADEHSWWPRQRRQTDLGPSLPIAAPVETQDWRLDQQNGKPVPWEHMEALENACPYLRTDINYVSNGIGSIGRSGFCSHLPGGGG